MNEKTHNETLLDTIGRVSAEIYNEASRGQTNFFVAHPSFVSHYLRLNYKRKILSSYPHDNIEKIAYSFLVDRGIHSLDNNPGITPDCDLLSINVVDGKVTEMRLNAMTLNVDKLNQFVNRVFLINPESMDEDRYLACIMEYDYNIIMGEDGYYYLTPQYVEKFMPELFKKYELLSKDKDI